MKPTNRYDQMQYGLPARQQGALTMFSAVLILILLTGMVIYAAQVGVFEQRKSGNELRQKQAFHSAEVGIQRAQEFLLVHVLDLTSPDDTTGWLSTGSSGRWVSCKGAYSTDDYSHPCWGEALDGNDRNGNSVAEPNLRDLSFFYSEDGATPTPIPIPIAKDPVLMDRATEASEVFALLCMLDVNPDVPQPVQGCFGDDQRDQFDKVFFLITLLARGRSECDDSGVNCRGEALVAQRIGSYGPVPGSGGPGAPLTSKSSLRDAGGVTIVANPNGGGLGVPVSAWIDGDADGLSQCDGEGGEAFDPQSNAWKVCEFQEWYGVDSMPDDIRCDTCSCSGKLLSHGNKNEGGYDTLIDPDFPCELFDYVFESTDVDDVKSRFTVYTDCASDVLYDPERAKGPIWISTEEKCTYNGQGGNDTIGSQDSPVFLVYSGPEIQFGGSVSLYGVLMTTDIEGHAGSFDGAGTGAIYGAVLVDGNLPTMNATFDIVWNDDLVLLATKRGSLGNLYGGWTDFHEDWR
jgi:hypothetical protein